MKLNFDLQFFGSGGTKTQQVRTRDPEPAELQNLRLNLYNKISPGIESFDTNAWSKAQDIANNAMGKINGLVDLIPGSVTKGNDFLDKLSETLSTGELPSGVTDKLNAGVNKSLQSSMGSMLNGLATRGVVNSSITSQGVNNLSNAAADAFNRNYLNAFNSVIQGYGSGIQGAQSTANSLLQGVNALGNIPGLAYEGAAAPLMPGFNFWNTWQSLQNSKPEEYDTIVQPKSSGCITGDTIITLEHGRKIPVSELKDNDIINAWDFDKGCLVSVPMTAFFKREFDTPLDVIRVHFEDGTTIGVIFEHLFFDLTLGRFIAVNKDSQDFTGHYFARVNDKGCVVPVKVTLIDNDCKTSHTYAPQARGHLNFLADGFITANDGQSGLCNRFDFDISAMRYNHEHKAADLEKYGRLDYKEFEGIISKDFFEHNHIDEFSVSIGKGLISLSQLKTYLAHFSHCFLE